MTSRRMAIIAGLSYLLLAGSWATTASAQSGQPAPPRQTSQPQQGPLVLERVESGFVVAPDVKVTDIDGGVGTLVGGYAGWIREETLLIGGAGYWLASGPGDLDMAYGGLLLGWGASAGSRIRFGVRGLVGGGEASVSDTFSFPGRHVPYPDLRPGHGSPSFPAPAGSVRVHWTETFFIFEPQGVVTLRLLDRVGLDLGVGYRVIGAADGVDNRLRGLTGSVAIRFGH
jgi:hypothetical protein